MVSIAGWVMPAPAPCANTKQARASRGRIRSAETAPDVPTSILSFCATTSFIAQTSRGCAESSTRETGRYACVDLKANGDPGICGISSGKQCVTEKCGQKCVLEAKREF